MFDIGFWELLLIGVVALLVIGPDKLPGLARTAGLWLGRARHFIGSVKADIDRELRADELRRAVERDAGLDELKHIVNSTRDTIDESTKQADYLLKAEPSETAQPPKSEEPSEPESPSEERAEPKSGSETRPGSRDTTHEQTRD